MRTLLSTISLLCFLNASAQNADFLILKKKSRTVKMFFVGSQIEFITSNGVYKNAVISDIKNDSIFLKEYLINRVPTTLGFYVVDTVGSFRYTYNYQQIYKFNKENKKFNVGGSGAALLGGGALIVLASGVVYLADNKNFSFPLLAAGAGLATIGYFITKKSSKGITVGKNRYTLQYINVSTKK
jgi:hypothetical protein